MNTKSAFPQHGWTNSPDVLKRMEGQGGMTMRQYYKAAALHVIDSRYTNVGNESACAYEIARYCGMIADAMLAEDEEHAKK